MLCWRLVKLIMTCLDKNIADTLDTFWLFSTKCPHNQFCFWFESPFVYHTRLWLLTIYFLTPPLLFLLQQTFSLKYLLDIFSPHHFFALFMNNVFTFILDTSRRKICNRQFFLSRSVGLSKSHFVGTKFFFDWGFFGVRLCQICYAEQDRLVH